MKLPTRAPDGFNKDETKTQTAALLDELRELQNMLYAQSRYSVLVVLQGMDASGKDGVIKKVFAGVNPMGCGVHSFKAPTELEKSHDFLWRVHNVAPARGMIQIFNRSHYEDVLVTRVNKWIDDKTAKERFKHINHFEALLQSNGTILLKFFLNVSKEEQRERLQERKDDPAKMWKHNESDWKVNEQYDDYIRYYEEAMEACGPDVPWIVVPADQNWYKEYLVAKTLVDALKNLPLAYPKREA
ncbi:MAG TPA: PPK2 family polyphosphate kinase [Chitinophagales bacterium]|nr:PPK2 family polyphosphate kinase [Chitinophagales bacterium]